MAASRVPRLLHRGSLERWDLAGSFCAYLLAFTNKAWLWGWSFIDRLPVSQGAKEGRRKSWGKEKEKRQGLLGGDTNEDKFPLSVSKIFQVI